MRTLPHPSPLLVHQIEPKIFAEVVAGPHGWPLTHICTAGLDAALLEALPFETFSPLRIHVVDVQPRSVGGRL